MRALALLLLLAGCAAAEPPPPSATPAEAGLSTRIGGSFGGYYTHTR